MRGGMPVYQGESRVGYVTSGTMVPYFTTGEEHAMRAIGFAYIDSRVRTGDQLEVDIRGRRIGAAIPTRHLNNTTPPYTRPVLYEP